jgi:5-dehydro-2-deoxygluconokinase
MLDLVGHGDANNDILLVSRIKRAYELGIYPDYWKLLPGKRETWDEINTVVDRYDPFCRGIVLCGQGKPEERLARTFQETANTPRRLGFAAGRGIFLNPLTNWFAGALSEEEFTAAVKSGFSRFINAWNGSRE